MLCMVICITIPRILRRYCVACRFSNLNFVIVALGFVVIRNLNFMDRSI